VNIVENKNKKKIRGRRKYNKIPHSRTPRQRSKKGL
jgi:hypothetical protein